MLRQAKYYVYILRSMSKPDKTYVGSSADLRQRLRDHNNGLSVHTAKFRPWKLEAYVAVANKEMAEKLEAYF